MKRENKIHKHFSAVL